MTSQTHWISLPKSFNRDAINYLNKELDAIPAGCRVLVTTGQGKYYNIGFDLEFLGKIGPEASTQFINQDYAALLLKWIQLPLITVAMFNGHVYAAGLAFAAIHDFRLVKSPSVKAWICMNEVYIPSTIPRAMYYALESIIPTKYEQRNILQFGQRLDLVSCSLIDKNLTMDDIESMVSKLPNLEAVTSIRIKRLNQVLQCINEDWSNEESPFRYFQQSKL